MLARRGAQWGRVQGQGCSAAPPPSICGVLISRHATPRGRSTLTQASSAGTKALDSVDSTVALLKRVATKPGAVPAPVVLDAMLSLEKAKLPTEGWAEALSMPGVHWRLIFTSDDKQVQAAKKQQPNKGGVYFPLPACQKFDQTALNFENGVFLGQIASLTFDGPYAVKGRQLSFDVVRMNVGLGPWRFSVPLKDLKAIADMDDADVKKLPFFLYAYVDKDIVVARGRSGGLALWQRADKDWEARSGVMAVYK